MALDDVMAKIQKAHQGDKTARDQLVMDNMGLVWSIVRRFKGRGYDCLLYTSWYIEMVKPRLWNDEDTTKAAAIWTLKTVLIQSLKLLHPYIPFITEEIFCNLQDEEESIMVSQWPVFKEEWSFEKEEHAVETMKEAVRAIRNVRTSMNVPPSKKAKVYVVSENEELLQIFEHSKVFFATLGYASEVFLQKDKTGIAEDAVSAVIPQAAIYMPFAELVDIAKEIERLEKEEERLTKELARVNGMLANEKFVSKACLLYTSFISDGAKSDCGNIQEIFSADSRIAVCDPVYPVYVDSNVMAGRTGEYDGENGIWSNVIYMPCTAENGFVPELPKETPDLIYLCICLLYTSRCV